MDNPGADHWAGQHPRPDGELPPVNDPFPPCLCGAQLADLVRAVEMQATRLDNLVQGVNTIGAQINQTHAFVGTLAEQIGKVGPVGLMKALMGGKVGNGNGD